MARAFRSGRRTPQSGCAPSNSAPRCLYPTYARICDPKFEAEGCLMVDVLRLSRLNLEETALLDDNGNDSSVTLSASATGFEPPKSATGKHHQRNRSVSSKNGAAQNSVQNGSTSIPLSNMVTTPRTATYERLETGMPVSRRGGFFSNLSKSYFLTGWRRLVVIALTILMFLFLFSRSSHSSSFSSSSPPFSSSPHPQLTFETDTNPLGTTHCSTPHPNVKSGRLVQYALIVDAGSTGSRIHIYKFNNCKASPTYEYEVFKQLQPGLSSYNGRPLSAAESLDPLLKEALHVVPESLRKCTPIAVKATAGLRLIGEHASKEILDAIEHRLRTVYPFPLPDTDAVMTISGTEEAVYAWITVNYLLSTILPTTPRDTPTYAVLDHGGGSTQIVFMPDSGHGDPPMEEGDHKYELEFSGRKFELYQHSYLGYGLNEARKSIHNLVEFMASYRANVKEKGATAGYRISNPCLSKGTTREVNITHSDTQKTVLMEGTDIGSFDSCKKIIEIVLDKDAPCPKKPCSFGSIYQPPLMTAFPAKSGKVLLLSYFYDRVAQILPALESHPPAPNDINPKTGHKVYTPPEFTPLRISQIRSLAQLICSGKEGWYSSPFISGDELILEDVKGRPEYCVDLTFMYVLLTEGYGFKEEREVWVGKRVDGTELGWAFGAGIGVVSGGKVKCKI
jgi:guanosine-diphosphatase